MTARPAPSQFRRRFAAGDHLVGTFVKTPATHPVEVIGSIGFDFVVIDEEHAPFDRVTIDNAILAARAVGTAALVRVAEPTAAKILSVLDDGATGILVPHVASAAKAREVVAAARYRGGKRGFTNSSRAGGFGARALWQHVDAADAEVTIIGMIEDPEALDQLDEILAVEGLDGVFIGRGDLTVALGARGMDAPEVEDACTRIFAAARKAGKPVCIMVGTAAEAAAFQARGASAYIVSTDLGFLRAAASKAFGEVAALSPR